ncbi:MAG: T9SS type A sorting domain-containing protein [Bacteroidota bacterium]
MKTIVPFKKAFTNLSVLFIFSTMTMTVIAQNAPALVFNNPTLKSGNDLKKGAVYLFKNVITGIDATVSIDDLVNGASVKKIDDNSGGLGYSDAFQPEVQIGGKGESYAVFTIKFINTTTNSAELMKSIQATSLDIDGTLTLKEFAEINMNGGQATYMGGALEILLKNIPIIGTLFNAYRADNISGIDRNGIDTTVKSNMYTVTKSDVSTFSIKYGATSLSSSNSSRQYSLYMKGFQYPNQLTLPLNLLSFTTTLDKSKVDLKWTTDAEKNVSHFAIEKSYDGKNFSDAATVFAFGNTTSKMDYSYADNVTSANVNIIYYRLRCIDNDGKFTYSDIRVVRIAQQDNARVLAYPNPFTNELRVTLPHNWQNKEAKIELFNTSGQLVKAKNVVLASQTETINTTDLGRGFYVIRITSDTEKVQYKVIKN